VSSLPVTRLQTSLLRESRTELDWSPFLRQTVKTHFSLNGELSHGIVTPQEFKLAAVRRLEQGVSIAEVARGLEVNPNVLHRWRREFRQGPGNAFPGNGKQRWSEGRVAELERKVGQQALEIDFLKGCLQHIEEQRMLQALNGNPRSSGRSKKK
jgi:transposase